MEDEKDYEEDYGNTKADGGVINTPAEFEDDMRDFLTGETLGENESFKDYNNRIEDTLKQFDRASVVKWLERNREVDEDAAESTVTTDSTPSNITINITTK